MGIVSIILLVATIVGVVLFALKLREVSEREEAHPDAVWALRVTVAVLAVLALSLTFDIVDSYFYKIRTPFDPPVVEGMPERARPAPETEIPAIKPAEKPDPMADAAQEHEDQLDDFERRTAPAGDSSP